MNRQIINVELGERRYPIHIQPGLLAKCGALLSDALQGAAALVVADEQVAALYGDTVLQQLRQHNQRVELVTFPAGETEKSLANAERLWQACAEHAIDRSATLIALGGGVTGDLCGFVAACWMRGIRFIQIPTSLLAMVDSSVGGKTGINSSAGKNLIGAFKQPACVLIDPALIQSMDQREYRSGLAEVLKYGIIYDADFLSWQEQNAAALGNGDAAALSHAVAESCRIKAHYVSNDEEERGIRAHLNYGHTFGHALERHTQYQQYLHGEAVGIGMRMAADLSERLGLLKDDRLKQRQNDLLSAYQLPLNHSCDDIQQTAQTLSSYCSLDKKVSKGQTRFVLVKTCGVLELVAAPDPELVAAAFASALESA